MIPWFLKEYERLRAEHRGLEHLQSTASWLIGHAWRITERNLAVDAVIRAHGHDYEVRLVFPPLYPEVPPFVRPLKADKRLTTHQYGGIDGPLCLEWGPDNWNENVTAVQMLESTHRLLDIENPLGSGDRPAVPAPSRHSLTHGQELRSEFSRWYVSTEVISYLVEQPVGAVGSLRYSFRTRASTCVAMLHEVCLLGGESLRDSALPKELPECDASQQLTGVWFRTSVDGATLSQTKNLAGIREVLGRDDVLSYIPDDGSSKIEGWARNRLPAVLVVDGDNHLHCFIILSSGSVVRCALVTSESDGESGRAPDATHLGEKKVGIVGLGSAGSKIAVTMARMGIRSFYFVDHDVLLPENLDRHALDWDGVAQHKADAIGIALQRIKPEVSVESSKLLLAGQESSAALGGVLQKLGGCGLIIDATADSRVFNLLSAVVKAYSVPLAWLEVFGGGIGGLIGRSRPGEDPTPQRMREVFLRYCAEHPAPDFGTASIDYAAETPDGEVLVASDADVAVVAHHAARLAVDCLVPGTVSRFPYSMYLIGLATGWVFDQPFSNIPISMEGMESSENMTDEAADVAETVEFLAKLIAEQDNGTSATS